jgi:hypothetical protein
VLFYWLNLLCGLAGASPVRGGCHTETVFEITDKVGVVRDADLAADLLNRPMSFRQQMSRLLEPGLSFVFPNTETRFFLEKMLQAGGAQPNDLFKLSKV